MLILFLGLVLYLTRYRPWNFEQIDFCQITFVYLDTSRDGKSI